MKLFQFIQKKLYISTILTVVCLGFVQIATAQFKIDVKIPEVKAPKVTKPKPKPENSDTNSNTDTNSRNENSTGESTNANQDGPPDWWLNTIVADINQARGEVDEYTPETKMFLVSSTLNPWLLRAVSMKAREEFAIDKKINDWRKANTGNKFDVALDALAASAAKKLPNYVPHLKNFAFQDATLDKLMKGQLKNPATLKILKSGIFHANWQIEKNDLGIPVNRYREAYIWAKDSNDDHPYCHLYGVVIQQDYAGGGTYGGTRAYLNTDTLFGCPAK